MALTNLEFLKLASVILPEYDGTFEELQRFVDAIELVEQFTGTYMNIAVAITKTKLKGTARNFIQDENSLKAIRDTLKKFIRPEPPALIVSKLRNLEQINKTPNEYIKELEILTTSLKSAYIVQGLSIELAEDYTTDTTVEVIKLNSINEKVKLIMEACSFKTVSEVCTKFLFITSEITGNKSHFVRDTPANVNVNQCLTNNSNNCESMNLLSKIQNNQQSCNENSKKVKKIPRYIKYMQLKKNLKLIRKQNNLD